jgi:hypothetical protein
MKRLEICPCSFREASAFVARFHRHHQPPRGTKFCIGACDGDELVGVVMVGRPIARHYDDGLTLEVNRSCTTGTANANSMLYAAAWRATKALGYRRLITYTRADESGISLKAAGWRVIAQREPRKGWSTPVMWRADKSTEHNVQRTLWEAM